MASGFDTLIGSVFSVIVLGAVIVLSFYGGLSPAIVGAAVVIILVIWYLARSSDVEPIGSFSSADNRTSSGPSGSGPDPDGPTLGGGNGGSGGGTNSPLIRIETPDDLEETIRASNVNVRVYCEDRSGDGLEALTLQLPDFGEKAGEHLNGVDSTTETINLARIIGDLELDAGRTEVQAILFDKAGNEARDRDVLEISNKSSGGKTTGMAITQSDFQKLREETDYEKTQLHDALEDLANIHEHHRYQSELEDKLLQDGKAILEDINSFDETLNRIVNGNHPDMSPSDIRDKLKPKVNDIHSDIQRMKEHLNEEMSEEETVEELMPELKSLFGALADEETRMEEEILPTVMKHAGSGSSSPHGS